MSSQRHRKYIEYSTWCPDLYWLYLRTSDLYTHYVCVVTVVKLDVAPHLAIVLYSILIFVTLFRTVQCACLFCLIIFFQQLLFVSAVILRVRGD